MTGEYLPRPAGESAGSDSFQTQVELLGTELQRQIDVAQGFRSRILAEKTVESESLLLSLRRASDLIVQCTLANEYLESAALVGDLNSEGRQTLDTIRAKLPVLRRCADDIRESLRALTTPKGTTEQSAIRDTTHSETQQLAFLGQEIDTVVNLVLDVARRRNELTCQCDICDQDLATTLGKIRTEIDKAKSLISKRYNFRIQLGRYDTERTWKAYTDRLRDLRASLGIFDAQEKAAVDHILKKNICDYFIRADKLNSDIADIHTALKRNEVEVVALGEKLKSVLNVARRIDSSVAKRTGGINTADRELRLVHRGSVKIDGLVSALSGKSKSPNTKTLANNMTLADSVREVWTEISRFAERST